MTRTNLRARALPATAGLILVGTALAGCSSASGQLGEDLATLRSCPEAGYNTQIGVDGSPSARSAESRERNLAKIESAVGVTALCGGTLRVFSFTSSSGQTTTMYQGSLSIDASTDNAKVRKANKLTESIMAETTTNYDSALDALTGSGTDVIGMLDLLRDARAQAPEAHLYGLLLTDGASNVGGVDPLAAGSTVEAEALADQIPVPDLSDAQIEVVGVGHQATGELPSSMIENLRAFWKRLLSRTGASSVLVVTEGL